MIGMVGVAEPLVGHGHASREGHLAIHHERPPMVALVEPRQLAEPRRAEGLDATPGRAQGGHPFLRGPQPSDAVEQHADLDARARARSIRAAKRSSLTWPFSQM